MQVYPLDDAFSRPAAEHREILRALDDLIAREMEKALPSHCRNLRELRALTALILGERDVLNNEDADVVKTAERAREEYAARRFSAMSPEERAEYSDATPGDEDALNAWLDRPPGSCDGE